MERISGRIKRVKRRLRDSGVAHKLVAFAVIASTALSPLSPVFASVAQAAEPETATVMLTQTEHGSLSFDDTDEMSKTVEVGSEVTVNATADEGYFADSLSVFSSEDEAEAVEVRDGKATFTVSDDVTVTATFYENGSAGSAAMEPVGVKEQRSDSITSVEQYIRENMDPQYVGELGEGEDLARKDMLHVTTTVVDGSKLPDATLDGLWADDDGDGLSDHWDAMLSNGMGYAVLFEASLDSDYYVAWVGADIEGGKLTDWDAAENNADANMRDGFIMDEATGLMYVPKAYTTCDDEGTPNVLSSRIQLVYTVQDGTAEASFDVSIDSDIEDDGIARSGKSAASVVNPYTQVVLAADNDARANLHAQSIDSVTVNGIEYGTDSGMWAYDEETGSISLHIAPQNIHVLTVSLSNSLVKDAAAFLGLAPQPRLSDERNNLGTWEFQTSPQVGKVIRATAEIGYNGDGIYYMPSYGYETGEAKRPATDSEAGMEKNIALQALGLKSVNLSKLFVTGNSLMRWADVKAQTVSGSNTTAGTVKIPEKFFLLLSCCHVGINTDFEKESGYDGGYFPSKVEGKTGKVQFRIMSVSGNTAIVGAVVPTASTQAGGGFFTIKWKVNDGGIALTKTSASTSITDGNDMYSLKGAVYGVYSDAACKKLVKKLTTDASGKATVTGLPVGTYYVKEITAPEGYQVDVTAHKVTVAGGKNTALTVKDTPANDPVAMLVGKYDGEKTYTEIEGNMPQGAATLEGAEFTIEYYDTLDYDDYDALKEAGVEPTRTWVFSTDSDGYAYFSAEYLVSGDDFYYDSTGTATMPRGTVVVYESKAPEGYNLNEDSLSFQKIQEEWTSAVITYNTPEVPDSVLRGGVAVQKLDAQTGQTPQGGGSFEGIDFSIINDNENSVIVDGVEYQPGEVVKTITTDESGYAATADDALPYGDYIIRESATNDTYLNTSDDIHVTVSEDGKVYEFTASDDVLRGGVEVYKRDLESDLDAPLGGAASFDGTTFEVRTQNDHPVLVDGVSYGKGEVVKTLTIKDGYAATDELCLPAGHYTLQEVSSVEGYNLTDGTAHEFTISENGVLVNPVTGDGHVHNQVKRSDLEFTKKSDATAERLAGVAFKVTSQTTGESHVVVTDENGYFSSASSWNAHTNNTNGNDWALDADGVIDSSKLDMTAGTWFGLTAEGTMTSVNDALGALPYDSYAIEELRCTANEGYTLIKTSVTVTRDGVTYDFGTLDDVQPEISTNAYDPVDGDKRIPAGSVSIADKVTYSGLAKGEEYKLVTTVVDAETGEAIETDGQPVSVTTTFTATGTTGQTVVEMEIPTYELGGRTVTVYEELFFADGTLAAEHKNKGDVDQQLRVIAPEIGTTAQDGVDGDHDIVTDDTSTVVDTVSYVNLIPGKEYTVTGTLHVKKVAEDGTVTEEALLDADGNPVTAQTTFTPENADGTVDVTFTFDTLGLGQGPEIVAFESLHLAGYELAVHADVNDEAQTVTVIRPEIGTTAKDGTDGDKYVTADPETTLVDTVAYKNLVPGKEHTVTGTLHVKKVAEDGTVTEEAMLAEDGSPVTAQTTFTPETADGTVDVTFTFDTSALAQGTDLVAFESLSRGDVELAVHADVNDEAQTVTITHPEIGTTAKDGFDGDKTVISDGETTVVDTIAYKNLVPGKEYTVTGTLHVKKVAEDGTVTEEALLDADGNPVTAEATFTPEEPNGTVDVTFTFDSSAISDGTELVAFESLSRGDVEMAVHADVNDEAQTVVVHETAIGTVASDGLDGDKQVVADAETIITDIVAYTDVLPGTEYTMAGILMDKATGLPILTGEGSDAYAESDVRAFMEALADVLALDADRETVVDPDALNALLEENADLVDHMVIASTAFTPEESAGTVTMDFAFDSNDVIDRLSGETKDVVVFEALFKGSLDGETEAELAGVTSETDLENAEQTVTLVPSAIGTNATDKSDGDKTLMPGKDAVITDTVAYENLIPGKEYTLKATLYDKATGEPLSVNDKHVTAELRFTPNSPDGSIDIDLGPFDASELDGHELVVFEELYKQVEVGGEVTDVLVAEHKDINDENQTVTVTDAPEGGSERPNGGTYGKTGGSDAAIVLAILAAIVLAGELGVYGFKMRRAAKAEAEVDDTISKPSDGSNE